MSAQQIIDNASTIIALCKAGSKGLPIKGAQAERLAEVLGVKNRQNQLKPGHLGKLGDYWMYMHIEGYWPRKYNALADALTKIIAASPSQAEAVKLVEQAMYVERMYKKCLAHATHLRLGDLANDRAATGLNQSIVKEFPRTQQNPDSDLKQAQAAYDAVCDAMIAYCERLEQWSQAK